MRSGLHGLCVSPSNKDVVVEDSANSGVALLPRQVSPARLKRLIKKESYNAMNPFARRLPIS